MMGVPLGVHRREAERCLPRKKSAKSHITPASQEQVGFPGSMGIRPTGGRTYFWFRRRMVIVLLIHIDEVARLDHREVAVGRQVVCRRTVGHDRGACGELKCDLLLLFVECKHQPCRSGRRRSDRWVQS